MTTHRILFFPSLLLLFTSFVGAQDENQYNYAKFSPKMAIIIVVLVAALFSMGFISIYIRHCSDTSAASGTVRRTLSMRGRRAAATRGLDASVIETFPTFKYSEVKGHKIGKGALECAVCLNEFEDDETLRLIPKCDHVFHPECIDTWLEAHVTCPVCRADLVPQPGDAPDQVPKPAEAGDEIAIQIDENRQQPEVGDTNRTGQSSDFPNQPPRSWSVRTARVFGLSKFRSHSTGHSLVQPGENLDRFTLRLPECMRKEMMDRAVLNRTKSVAVMLPRERSSRAGRLYRGIDSAKSDRWAFFSRGLSVRSSNVVEAGESSGSSGAPVKLPSFNCLEPKTSDEIVLIPKDRS